VSQRAFRNALAQVQLFPNDPDNQSQEENWDLDAFLDKLRSASRRIIQAALGSQFRGGLKLWLSVCVEYERVRPKDDDNREPLQRSFLTSAGRTYHNNFQLDQALAEQLDDILARHANYMRQVRPFNKNPYPIILSYLSTNHTHTHT
jgi:hypothetical protein